MRRRTSALTLEPDREATAARRQTWCHLSTDRMRAYSVLRDPHAPPHVRVNAALSQASPRRILRAALPPPIDPSRTLNNSESDSGLSESDSEHSESNLK